MNEEKIRPYFFFGLLLLVSALIFLIFTPFLGALLLAGAFALIFHPTHDYILRHIKWPSFAAFLTLTLIILIVIVPIIFLSGEIFVEGRSFLADMSQEGTTGPVAVFMENTTTKLQEFAPFISFNVEEIQKEILDWFIANFNILFAGVLKTVLNIFIFLFALYYLIRDGHKLKKFLITLSPLRDTEDAQIFQKLKKAINSVVVGSLLVAIVQGALTAIGFVIFGIPHAILWGAIGAVFSLIPNVGPTLLFVPAVIIAFLTGDNISALGLAAWGILAVSPIDNIMRPFLIEKGMKIHPFMILVSVIGGLSLFGPIGFLLGPVILSLFFALISIYLEIIKSKN